MCEETMDSTVILLILTCTLLCLQIAATQSTINSKPSRSKCKLLDAKNDCKYFILLAKPDFHAFIPAEILNETCSLMQMALKCVEDYYEGCDPMDVVPFNVQKNVVEAVCNDYKQEYLKGARCFSSPKVKYNIMDFCLSKLTEKEAYLQDPCRLMKTVSKCTLQAIRMADVCTEDDEDLMEILIEAYLDPSVGRLCDTWKLGQLTSTTVTTRKVGKKADMNSSLSLPELREDKVYGDTFGIGMTTENYTSSTPFNKEQYRTYNGTAGSKTYVTPSIHLVLLLILFKLFSLNDLGR